MDTLARVFSVDHRNVDFAVLVKIDYDVRMMPEQVMNKNVQNSLATVAPAPHTVITVICFYIK